jgi:3',5'-cyclic AMP phosphodiesterase CpdA
MERRDFLKLAGIGIVMVSGLDNLAEAAEKMAGKSKPSAKMAGKDFFFVQLSDSHWGFNDPKVNPDFAGTLQKAVALVNDLTIHPDFIVFTGDLTHTTDDGQERRKRLAEFRKIVSGLKVKNVKFLPGEHDASLDNGKAFHEAFGKSFYTFNHKGVHFIVLDNVSDPGGSLGDNQLKWLDNNLKKLDKNSRLVVLTHRPLFDLYPQWEWATRDGAKAIDLLMPYKNVVVFYGHIHQENHHKTEHIGHHAAHGLMYPLPAPGSQPKRAPVPWDPDHPYNNLGFRSLEAQVAKPEYVITEFPLQKA